MAWRKRQAVDREDDGYEEDALRETEEDARYSGAEPESSLKDYNEYHMTARERLFYLIFAAAVIFAVGMIFYHNAVFAGILSLAALRYPEIRRRQLIRRQKQELTIQFKDLLYSLAAAMSAGRSMKNAFELALRDMEILYPDKNTPIMRETAHIVRLLNLNGTETEAIAQFARRAHIDDIQNFADAIQICESMGGDLIDVTRSTSQIISEKIETKNEIETIITAKKFESRILCVVPIFLVAMLSAVVPDFMEPVFNWRNPAGPLVMTAAIALFVAAYLTGEKIMDIEV